MEQKTIRRTSILLLLISLFLPVMPVITLASTPTPMNVTGSKIMVADNSSDILSSVQNAESSDSVTGLTASAKTAGNSLVTFLRTVGIIVAVIALVFVGYGLWFSPNVKTITDMKGRVGALVLGIIVSFMAEQIVGTVLMWLNVKSGG